jgi:hypothetical protein
MMELPREILEAREESRADEAEQNRWVYALSTSRMLRKELMRNDERRITLDARAVRLSLTMSSRELIGLAGYYAAVGNRYEACAYVRAYLKQQRRASA